MAVPPQPALYPSSNDAATSAAIALLIHYFDLAPASAQLLVKKWLASHPAIWVRAAVTEALYQGRYKPVSVEQILSFWQRRERSIVHFNKEFETLIAVPLQGSFKTETDVATEGNGNVEQMKSGTVSPGPAIAPQASSSQKLDPEVAQVSNNGDDGDDNWAATPDMTLAEAFNASAEQGQLAPDQFAAGQLVSSPEALPCPRLMLPGELPGKDLVLQAKGSSQTSHRSDNVLTPDPQAPQSPAPVLLPEAKSQPIQPPPIGRFAPAVDPSGFASRLKTVVQQAVAQTQAGEAQLSLETAIASQLASDPVLSQLSSTSDDEVEADDTAEKPEASTAPFADRFAMASPADSTSQAERSAFRDELDLELDALALDSDDSDSDSIGKLDSNRLDSTSEVEVDNSLAQATPAIDAAALPEPASQPLEQTAEPLPSPAVEIVGVSQLMAGLTAANQPEADETAFSLDSIGTLKNISTSSVEPLLEEDEKTSSD